VTAAIQRSEMLQSPIQ